MHHPTTRSRVRRRASFAAASTAGLALLIGLAPGPGSAAAPGVAHRPVAAKPADPVRAAITALRAHPAAARASEGQTFRELDTIIDADGTTHVRLARAVDGVPVVGGDVVVHQRRDGSWQGVSQTLRTDAGVSLRPGVNGRAATQRALGARDLRAVRRVEARDRRLVVDALSGEPRLAWEITTAGIRADQTPSLMLVYVDARNGEVLRTEERIQTADGDGQSLYSGIVPLQLTQSGSTYQMKDPTRGNTYTIDVNGKTDAPLLCPLLGLGCATGPVFSGPDTHFGSGTNANRESAGVDAQYGTNVTWDYFKNVHSRNGIFGNGTGSFNRVHYGRNYVNAFWDGTKMTYGDGDGVDFGPLVSLDVAGHEMSHGVTQNTANLTYSGESGGINEATSDIFGTMVEFYAANSEDPADYYIGEEFDLAEHDGFRRMDDPALDGNSHSCWSSATNGVDVHYSSGVGNHFFYLLAEGSGPKTIGGVAHNSPTCDGSSITGIGRDAAEQIWFRALTVYMTSGTKYAGARTATLSAAADLFGQGTTQYDAVAAAWSAVNVG